MDKRGDRNLNPITGFTCKCKVATDEVYILEPTQRMLDFFGTTPASYDEGVLSRIAKDISEDSARMIADLCFEKAANRDDFRLMYPSMRADGSRCYIQMDAYYEQSTDDGVIYNVIDMDVSEVVESKKETERLAEENRMLLDDSPVGLGIYHIRGDMFELVYNNSEYYRVHHGSREYWDRYEDKDALLRIHPDDRHVIIEEFKRVITQNIDTVFDASYRCRGEDGQFHWVKLLGKLSDEIDGLRICHASYLDIDAEKEAEERAERMNRVLIDTVSNIPSVSALFYLDEANTIRPSSYSDAFCSMMGCSQEEIWSLFGEDFFTMVHPDDREDLRRFTVDSIGGERMGDATFRLLAKPDDCIWVNMNLTIFDAEGRRYLYAAFADITEIKSNEARLAREYAEQQSYLESMSDSFLAIMRFDVTEDRLEMVKGSAPLITSDGDLPSLTQTMAYVASAIPRKEDRTIFIDSFSRDSILAAYRDGRKSISQEYYFISSDGKPGWAKATMHVMRHPENEDIIAFGTVEDINEEVILRRSNKRIIERNHEAVAFCDIQADAIHIQTTANPAYLALEGLPLEHVAARIAELYVEPSEAAMFLRASALDIILSELEREDSYSVYFTEAHLDETSPQLSSRKMKYDVFFLDDNRDILIFLLTDVTDIYEQERTNREQMATALAAAEQASVAKTEFLSRMSHEIRTPMNAIIGLDAIALQEEGLSPAMKDHLQKIGISARFLLALINDILDMSRIESGRMVLSEEPFDFEEMVSGINTILYEQCRVNDIEYECVLQTYTEPTYVGDVTKLQQILINILGNAVKFTPAGGKVHFLIRQVSTTNDKARLRFEIADTGIGIEEEFIPYLFQAFTQENRGRTSAYGGTGLGLAISRNIARLMGGDITVHSIKNVGTEFTVEIELGLDEKPVRPRSRLQDLELKPLFTLIVDDDPIVCQHTRLVLSEAGLMAEWVTSGSKAVETVTAHHRDGKDYDLILLDWSMPDMDGIETAREIRKVVGPEVTIIIMTAYEWSDIEQRAKLAGVDSFIRKPVFASAVTATFEDIRITKTEADQSEKPSYDFNGKHILLAEDNDINAEIAQRLLEMQRCSVEVAGNGAEAIEMFAASPIGHYDAILMDVRMPVMDGLEATRTIRAMRREDGRSIPIIAMTANAFEEDVNLSLQSGMNAHLAKPIEPEVLFSTLDRFISDDGHPTR